MIFKKFSDRIFFSRLYANLNTMKDYIFFLILFLSTSVLIQGQDEMTIKVGDIAEVNRFMSKGEQNAFTVIIRGADLNSTSNYWQKYVKRLKGKDKVDKKTGEVFSDNCKIPEISENQVDVYARFTEESTDEIAVFTWYDLGGTYLTSEVYPEKSAHVRNVLQEFARFVAKSEAEVFLTLAEKSFKDLNKDLSKLERENTGYHKKIEEAQLLIAKMENEIKLNLEAQAAKKDELKAQLETVNQAKAKVASFK